MDKKDKLWEGLAPSARKALQTRDYRAGDLRQRITSTGLDVGELIARDRARPDVEKIWIPGVEIFPRTIHSQRHRGIFGELVRRDESVLGEMKLWPAQWAVARMYAGSAKGFHIHPPHVPAGSSAAAWFKKLFVDEPENYALRPYDQEQWDVMFFAQGSAEVILRDVREGLPSRIMRFFIQGDNHRGDNNAGIVVPPGVAHAIRAEGSEDLIMIYGTSTTFHPEFEGRIHSEIETAPLPAEWQKFLSE